MSNILIFTGAGCSYPLGLPITTGFDEVVRNNLSKSTIRELLKGYLGNSFNDVEHIMSTLEFFTENKSFLKHIINNSTAHDSYFAHVSSKIEEYKTDAHKLIYELKGSIFNLLKDFDEEKASELYKGIIKECRDVFDDCNLSIFTANYDLTFEKSIDLLGEYFESLGVSDFDFGFKTNKRKTQIFDSKQEYFWSNSVIEYKKLHGSLDWILDKGNCIMAGGFDQPQNPNEKLLLYPGFKGTPTKEPFKSLHDQFFKRVLDADIFISIGFAFRDPYINSIINTAFKINEKLAAICFNPCDINKLPQESAIPELLKEFPNTFYYHKKGIEISDNPLSLSELFYEINKGSNKAINIGNKLSQVMTNSALLTSTLKGIEKKLKY